MTEEKKEQSFTKKLAETEVEHTKVGLVESGELANEFWKSYEKELQKAIEDHRKFKFEKLWFPVMIKKSIANSRIISIVVGVSPDPISLRPDLDLWEYDYLREKLNLVYSLPHVLEMKNFLRSEEKYSKKLIEDIRNYLASIEKSAEEIN